jgi:hypothetical protein
LGSFAEYWRDNWPALLPAIIFLLVNPWSIWSLLRTTTARRERITHAHEDLVDLMESALVSGGRLTRSQIYRLADSVAERRQAHLEDVYRPVAALRATARRVERNPALTDRDRQRLAGAVDRLIRQTKAHEGTKMLAILANALRLADKGYRWRDQAKNLMRQLDDWSTYDDTVLISSLVGLRPRLTYPDVREEALRLVGDLAGVWAALAVREAETVEP